MSRHLAGMVISTGSFPVAGGMDRIGRGLCQTAGAGEPGRPAACTRRVVPVWRRGPTPEGPPRFSCPLIVLSMGTDRGEKRVFVSKDTSLISAEARGDGTSSEPNGSRNRDRGAEKTPGAVTSPPLGRLEDLLDRHPSRHLPADTNTTSSRCSLRSHRSLDP